MSAPEPDQVGPPPWSPFPVQDWSRLPLDPLGPSAPDPTWPPPPDRRRWWVPLVVLLTIGALLAGTAYAGVAVGSRGPRTAALDYLPRDGSVTYDRVETTEATRVSVRTNATESAILTAAAALQSADATFTARAIEVADYEHLRIWRTVSTPLDGAAGDQTTRLYEVRGPVVLRGESGPTVGYAYRPGLVELPAAVGPGQSWGSEGTAGGTLTYQSRFQAAAGPDGCLLVTGEITYRTVAAGQQFPLRTERTWCPGRGLVGQTDTIGADRVVTAPVSTAPVSSVATASAPFGWPDPSGWQERDLATVSSNRLWGEASMTGVAAGGIRPVRTQSGLIVRPLMTPTDLVGTRRLGANWATVWRAHPGGALVTLASFGDVVVVTTSERRVVAYTDTGARLWSRELDDVGPSPAVRLSDTQIVVVDLSGAVSALDLRSGSVVWTSAIGSDVALPPAVGEGLVVVADRNGTTTALAAESGAVRWTRALSAKAGLVVGGTVVIVQDQTVHGLDPGTGKTRWLRPFLGTFTELAALGTRTVLASRSATVVIDQQGTPVARLQPNLQLCASADAVVGWGETAAEVFDASGRVQARWPLERTGLATQNRMVLATPDGPLLFSSLGWTLKGWSR